MARNKTDNELFEGLRNGDKAVIPELYARFLPSVVRYITGNQGTKSEAEDIFQLALLQLVGRIKTRNFPAPESFGGYLFTACKYLWLRELKKRQTRQVTSDTVRRLYYEADDLAQATLEQERRELFAEKMKSLSDNCREILGYLFQKIPGKEIMDRMGYRTENTVRQRIYKCKLKLIKLIEEDPRFAQLQYK